MHKFEDEFFTKRNSSAVTHNNILSDKEAPSGHKPKQSTSRNTLLGTQNLTSPAVGHLDRPSS